MKAIKVVEKEMGKIDLVQVNVLTRPGVIAVLMYCFSRIPYIVVEHWTGYASGKFQSQSFIKRCISTYIVSKAKAVVVVSKSLKDKMLELGLKNKYVVIPNVIENVCLQKKRDSDVIKILTVADLYDLHKNISDVLSVISKIINETDYKIEYHVIGGGPDEFILREKSDKLGLTNRVVFFHGRQTNEFVYEFYKEIDFVIINSRLETFSVVATEAIVNGKPLITTVCGGPEEFITEKQGVLIEKDNVEELKKAILFMLHNYKMYNAEALNEYAMSKFSYHIIGKQFYDLYNDIIKNNNA
ncbi:MAG: glycosyltransferase [Bacteroidia bacterium]|nr:glycosyltransferase [Bacteroidia bacterium]